MHSLFSQLSLTLLGILENKNIPSQKLQRIPGTGILRNAKAVKNVQYFFFFFLVIINSHASFDLSIIYKPKYNYFILFYIYN